VLRLTIDPARARDDAAGVAKALMGGSPAVAVGLWENTLSINPVTLREEDDGIVVSRLGTLLL
jgi:hypothetical protein